jgi:diguanylate cyclase (GGDEF)-like protein
LFGLLLPVQNNFMVYTLVTSFVLAIPLLSLAVLSWRLGYGAVRWPMALLYALGGALLMLRALGIWFSSGTQAPIGIFHADALSAVTFMILFAMTITGSFGFLEMRRQRAESEILHLAMFDSLTDLLNRRAFLELAERELSRARRTELPFCMLMIDIDHFKIINDTYGHAVGDRVLSAIAEVAKRSLRREDLLGRYGGEEFCALLPSTNLNQGLLVAERIRAAVTRLAVGGISSTVTVSIGVTICDNAGENEISAGLQRADQALYHAKHSGRNCVVAFEAMQDEMPGLPYAAGQRT